MIYEESLQYPQLLNGTGVFLLDGFLFVSWECFLRSQKDAEKVQCMTQIGGLHRDSESNDGGEEVNKEIEIALSVLQLDSNPDQLPKLEKLENVANHNIMYLKKAMRNSLLSENDKANFDCTFDEALNMPSLVSLRCKFLIVRGLLKITGFGKEWHLQNEFGFELDDMYNT